MRAVFVVLALTLSLGATIAWATVGWTACKEHFLDGVTPSTIVDSVAVCRGGYYAISYDPSMENPAWTAYHITRTDTRGNIAGREDTFHKDPDLTSLGVTTPDNNNPVFGDDYNRGHLAPNQILSYTEDAKYQTFTTSNIAPQWGQFNQQPWSKQEGFIFDWINESTSASAQLYIVTGIGYASRSSAKKTSGVAIPTYYFAAICDPLKNESVAFIGRNEKNGGGILQTYRTVDDVAATVYCGVKLDPASAGPSNSFRIFPSRCRTDRFNAKHWAFPGYGTSSTGANCSVKSVATVVTSPSIGGGLGAVADPSTNANGTPNKSSSSVVAGLAILGSVLALVIVVSLISALVRRRRTIAAEDPSAVIALGALTTTEGYGGVSTLSPTL